MALTLVMTTILIVFPLMVNFTTDVFVNKLKVYNIEDRYRARLTAESALKFAMARLRLYKEAYNFLQKNEQAKEFAKQETLDIIWNFPFAYPVPSLNNMNSVQKEAIADFNNDTNLDGAVQLTIVNISNKINLNLLRISMLIEAQEEAKRTNQSGSEGQTKSEEDAEFNVETQLYKLLTNAIEKESEKDDYFNAQYYGMEVDPLINELKYFMSDPGSIEDAAGGDRKFLEEGISPKKGPIISFSELYTLPGWPDNIINLIANEFTVHGAIMIDLNKITDKLLKILIPNINDEEVSEFFKYKDDPEDPKYFNKLEDFREYIVRIASIMTESDFDERFNKFKQQGLKFGPTPTLFKVNSIAKVGRSEYKLTAYVVIPPQPEPRPKTTKEEGSEPPGTNPPDDGGDGDGTKPQEPQKPNEKKEKKTLLLEPRVVEIIIG